ncbi:MAG: twin-arginine translocation signal domain-containing protein [Alphaproteobacteria bacterium]|nr:twin-arginine translocation signal domain-containing protein [Alphaproteobacteria bacterium]
MNPKNFHISRRAFLGTTAAASVAGMLGGMPIRAFGKDQVKLSFMYPVGVSGDINRIVSGMMAAFNAAYADV